MEEGTKIARALAAWTNKLRGEQHPAFVLSLPSCVPGNYNIYASISLYTTLLLLLRIRLMC